MRRSFKERRKFEYGKCYDYFRSKAKMTKKSSYIEAHITCTKCVQIFIQYLKLKKTNLKRKLIKSTFWHRCLIWNARNANACNRQCPNGILKRSLLSIAPIVLKERTSERTNEWMNEWTNDSRLTLKLTPVFRFSRSHICDTNFDCWFLFCFSEPVGL